MTALSDLIARLETTKEGSRELDAAIDIYVTGGSSADLAYVLEDVERTLGPKHYTTSLDAALTLVPKEYAGNWDLKWRNKASCRAELYRPSYQVDGLAATPALALCIASLRAREEGR